MAEQGAPVVERDVQLGDVTLHVLEAGEGPPVILAHGFPELAYSWRHQLPALAAAGYHVVAPDQRGYGRSSIPERLEDYDIHHLTGDLIALLDSMGEERAVFVGHDWGSMVVWQLALMHPERVAGVVGMSVPFSPRGPMPPTQLMRQVFGEDSSFYILYFQQPGVADAELGRDAATTMRRVLAGVSSDPANATLGDLAPDPGTGFVERMPEPERLPDWLSQEEVDVYAREFSRTGFTGGINWYRNLDRNWATTEHLAGAKVEVPSLFIGGTWDPVLVMSPPANQDAWLSDHRGTVLIDRAGHWVQQEAASQVNEALLSFLGQVSPVPATTTHRDPEGN